MKEINWKNIAVYAGIVLLFAVAAAIYFFPSLQGKVIYAGDSINAIAAVQESKAYAAEGGNTFWTGAIFSGMPNYQIGGGRTLSNTIMRPMNELLVRQDAIEKWDGKLPTYMGGNNVPLLNIK